MDELGSLDDRRIAPKPPHDQPVHKELSDVANDAPIDGPFCSYSQGAIQAGPKHTTADVRIEANHQL